MDKQTHINLTQSREPSVGLTMEDLEHLASCDFCVEQFADYIENQEFLAAPRYLKEDILKRSQQFEVQIVAKSNQASKKLELFYYTLKVGFAAAFAIAFLVIAPSLTSPAFPTTIAYGPVSQSQEHRPFSRLFDGALRITDKLSDLTGQLYEFKMEVTPDDKQEK